MLKLALTGSIACGKNYIAALFEEKGCFTIDADEISRIVMRKGGLAYEGILSAFGSSVLFSDGEIDRATLRSIVTDNADKRLLLESIVHPAIAEHSKSIAKEIAQKNPNGIILYHAPLIIESGNFSGYDTLILVWCSRQTQLKRLKERGYPPYGDALKLLDAQLPHEEKLKYAHHVINNDSDEANARQEVDRVYNLLKMFEHTVKINKRNKKNGSI